MSIKRIFILIVSITSLFSCSNSEIEKVFTKKESKELQQIIQSFDSNIKNEYSGKSLESAYKEYAFELKKFHKKNYSLPNNNWIKEIVNEIQQLGVYSEIWWNAPNNKSNININLDGKYMNFLNKMGEKDKYFDSYHSMILNSGDFFSPTVTSSFFLESTTFNFSSKEERLIFIIHYLTFYSSQIEPARRK